MCLHANAKLGLAGRLALVRAIEDGLSLRGAARSEADTNPTHEASAAASRGRPICPQKRWRTIGKGEGACVVRYRCGGNLETLSALADALCGGAFPTLGFCGRETGTDE